MNELSDRELIQKHWLTDGGHKATMVHVEHLLNGKMKDWNFRFEKINGDYFISFWKGMNGTSRYMADKSLPRAILIAALMALDSK